MSSHLLRLQKIANRTIPEPQEEIDILGLTQQQVAFGYTSEELDLVIRPMVKDGQEALGSMGDDTPLAVLSLQPRLLYTYFKQLFAQVTNPPIDPIREKLVMSLATIMGWRRNLFAESPEHAKMVHSDSPVLLEHELDALGSIPETEHKSATIAVALGCRRGRGRNGAAVSRISAEAERAVDDSVRLIILSDRGVDHDHVAIPMLLATGAVHHHLTRAGKRMKCSIICDTGEARDVHQIACLIGYGASAVCPYIAYETVRELIEKGQLGESRDLREGDPQLQSGDRKGIAQDHVENGDFGPRQLSRRADFRSNRDRIETHREMFRGNIVQDRRDRSRGDCDGDFGAPKARPFGGCARREGTLELGDPGYYRFRRQGEMHAVTPPMIKNFHTFVKSNKPEDYKTYVEAVKAVRPNTLRDLLERIPTGKEPMPLEEVESIEEIRRRFTTAGMSLGAMGPEAHECLAIAMNRIGGKSNSGEGGEDPKRFHRRQNGDWPNSAIKQIAAGRFGVNAAYLAAAKEIEIKMAQGAKPGEGGQLPGQR